MATEAPRSARPRTAAGAAAVCLALIASLLSGIAASAVAAVDVAGQDAPASPISARPAAPDPDDAVAVATGDTFSCSLDVSGTARCWGSDRTNRNEGSMPDPQGTYASIVATDRQVCALGTDHRLECWTRVGPPPPGTYTDVAMGNTFACALATDQTIDCWGSSVAATPPAGTFTQVTASRNHACAIATDQTITCWGSDEHGQASPPAGTFTEVSAGLNHTCAVATDASLACWGRPSAGQTSPPAGTFTRVASGYRHSCALRTDQTLACWGRNTEGEATPPAGTFVDVAVSLDQHSCAAATDGEVECWGLDTSGQSTTPTGPYSQIAVGDQLCAILGDATLRCWGQTDGVAVDPPAGTFIDLDVDGAHACAVATAGALACWGSDPHGTEAPPPGSFTDVDTGTDHSCAVRSDGAVLCWGSNGSGQSSAPAGTFTAVGAGDAVSCGVRTDGTVLCWGDGMGPGGSTPLAGTYASLAVADADELCGLRTDGSIGCAPDLFHVPPGGAFTQLSGRCGIRAGGAATCWGSFGDPDQFGVSTARWMAFRESYQICVVDDADGRLHCAGALYETTGGGIERLPADPGLRYTPLEPQRILDTRRDLGLAGPFGPRQQRELAVTGVGGIPADAAAVVLNVTIASADAATDVRLWPAGQPRPGVSNLNAVPGATVAVLATVKVGEGGRVAIANQSGTTHLVADVVGAYRLDGDLVHLSTEPARILDTRSGVGLSGPFAAGEVRRLTVAGAPAAPGVVPADATAALVNLTATGATAATDVRAWPAGLPTPWVSNLNVAPGRTVANLVIVPLGDDGAIELRSQSGTVHLVADLIGFTGPLQTPTLFNYTWNQVLHPIDPARVLDSRSGIGTSRQPWSAGVTRWIRLSSRGGVPHWPTAALLSVTATAASEATHISVGASGPSGSSSLNVEAGGTASNLTIPTLDDLPVLARGLDAEISNASGTVSVIGDVVGWFDSAQWLI